MTDYEKTIQLRDLFQQDDELRTSVETFLKFDLNASKAASALYMHRNTLEYRFKTILEKTGLNVKRFHDAMLAQYVLDGMRIPAYQMLSCLDASVPVELKDAGGSLGTYVVKEWLGAHFEDLSDFYATEAAWQAPDITVSVSK